MSRVALQPNLFAPSPTANPSRSDLLLELLALLAKPKSADRLPWPYAAAAMAEERRAQRFLAAEEAPPTLPVPPYPCS